MLLTGAVDGSGGDHPFAGLAGDPADQVEVRVVVKQDEVALLGRGGDQEVGDLAAAETPRGKEPLDLARPLNVRGIRLDQRKRGKRRSQAVPLGEIASRETYFEVRNARSSDLAGRGTRFEHRAYRPVTKTGQYAGVDHVCQRHASLRSRSFAFDSVSNALATRCCRFGATRRSASLTVSFKVFVPSSARAAASARSSMSTNRLAMARSISGEDCVYPRGF